MSVGGLALIVNFLFFFEVLQPNAMRGVALSFPRLDL